MILEENKQIGENNLEDSPIRDFGIQYSSITFQILTSKLYNDPEKSVIRELLSNAYESHMMAGTLDKKIEVSITGYDNTILSIRDYGLGLTEEEVYSLYTTFFASSKRDSNDYTGALGLGSKVPFAITNHFTVESFKNGLKTIYAISMMENMPKVIKMNSEATIEENGIKINIPIPSYDKNVYTKHINYYTDLIKEYRDMVDYNCRGTTDKERYSIAREEDNTLFLVTRDPRHYSHEIYIKHGLNLFILDYKTENKLSAKGVTVKKNIDRSIKNTVTTVIEVPIGSLSFTPNRENLVLDEKTITAIENALIKAENTITKIIEEEELATLKESNFIEEDAYMQNKIDKLLKEHFGTKGYKYSNRGVEFYYGISSSKKYILKLHMLLNANALFNVFTRRTVKDLEEIVSDSNIDLRTNTFERPIAYRIDTSKITGKYVYLYYNTIEHLGYSSAVSEYSKYLDNNRDFLEKDIDTLWLCKKDDLPSMLNNINIIKAIYKVLNIDLVVKEFKREDIWIKKVNRGSTTYKNLDERSFIVHNYVNGSNRTCCSTGDSFTGGFIKEKFNKEYVDFVTSNDDYVLSYSLFNYIRNSTYMLDFRNICRNLNNENKVNLRYNFDNMRGTNYYVTKKGNINSLIKLGLPYVDTNKSFDILLNQILGGVILDKECGMRYNISSNFQGSSVKRISSLYSLYEFIKRDKNLFKMLSATYVGHALEKYSKYARIIFDTGIVKEINYYNRSIDTSNLQTVKLSGKLFEKMYNFTTTEVLNNYTVTELLVNMLYCNKLVDSSHKDLAMKVIRDLDPLTFDRKKIRNTADFRIYSNIFNI